MVYQKISGFSDEISRDVCKQFAGLNKLNISYFEPRGIGAKNIADLNDDEVAELKAAMEKYGIKVSSIGSPIGKIKLTDSFEEHFETFKRVVKTAKELDTRYIRMFSFYHEGGSSVWTDEERAEVLLRLKKMIAYAKEQDVVLLHENEKDIYGDTAARCEDLMKELYCDYFKAVFDPANFVQVGENTINALEKLQSYVEYVHIKDAYADDGKVVPVGYGDGNVEYLLRKLFEGGYDGFLSIEPHLRKVETVSELDLGDMRSRLPEGDEACFTLAYWALLDLLNKI